MEEVEKLRNPTDSVLSSEPLPALFAEVDGLRARSKLIVYDASTVATKRDEALKKIEAALQGLAEQWRTLQQSLAEGRRLEKEQDSNAESEKEVEAEEAKRQSEREAAMGDLDARLRQARERSIALKEEIAERLASIEIIKAEGVKAARDHELSRINLRTAGPEGTARYSELANERYHASLDIIDKQAALAKMPADARIAAANRAGDSLETVRRFLRKLGDGDLADLGVSREMLSAKLDRESPTDEGVERAERNTEKTQELLPKAYQAIDLGKKALDQRRDDLSKALEQAEASFKAG